MNPVASFAAALIATVHAVLARCPLALQAGLCVGVFLASTATSLAQTSFYFWELQPQENTQGYSWLYEPEFGEQGSPDGPVWAYWVFGGQQVGDYSNVVFKVGLGNLELSGTPTPGRVILLLNGPLTPVSDSAWSTSTVRFEGTGENLYSVTLGQTVFYGATLRLNYDANSNATIQLGNNAGGIYAEDGIDAHLTGQVSGAVLRTGGPGSITFSGTILASALDVQEGTTKLAGTARLGQQSWVNVNESGVLDFNGTTGNLLGGLTGEGMVDAGNDLIHVSFDGTERSFAGTLLGTSGLRKSGSGTQVIATAQTFTGDVQLAGGSLAVVADSGLGDASNSIAFSGGTLRADASFSSARAVELHSGGGTFETPEGVTLTWNGAIAGAGNLAKSGAGTVILSGENSSSGNTTVNAGTLLLSASGTLSTGVLTVASGAGVDLNHTPHSFAGLAGGGAIDFGAAGIDLELGPSENHTFAGTLTTSGGLRVSGSGTQNIASAQSFTGGITIGTGATLGIDRDEALGDTGNEIAIDGGTLRAGANFASNRELQFANGGGLAASTGVTATWQGTLSGEGGLRIGGAGTTVLTGPTLPNGELDLAGGTLELRRDGDSILSAATSGAGSLTHAGTGVLTVTSLLAHDGATTVSAGTLRLGETGGLSATSAVTVAEDAVLDLADRATTTAGLDGAGAILINAGGLTVNGGGSFAGVISGAAGLTKAGVGTLTLAGANTFEGGTSIVGGTLRVGAGGTSGALRGDVAIAAGSAVVFNRSDAVSFAGDIAGEGAFEKAGGGSLTLVGGNTWAGGTTISAGALRVGAGGTAGSIAGDVAIAEAATLVFDRADAVNFDGEISGAGALQKAGAGTLTLEAANSFTGGTTIAAGTLALGHADALGALGTVEVAAGAVLDLGAFDFAGTRLAGTGVVTTGGVVSFALAADAGSALALQGAGSLVKTGAGVLTLSGENTLSGGTTVSMGTLRIGAGGTSGSLAGDVVLAEDASIRFDRADAASFVGAITGDGTLEKAGAGVLTLTGANAITGGTTILAGTLQIGAGGTVGSLAGDVSVENGATLAFNRADASTFSSSVSGDGAVVKRGAGTLTLSGLFAHAGGTTIEGGTLEISHGDTVNGGIAIAAGAALAVNNAGSVGLDKSLEGGGTLVKRGEGELAITGSTSHAATRIEGGLLSVDGFQNRSRLGANHGITIAAGGTFEIRGVNPTPSEGDAIDVTVEQGGTFRVSTGGSPVLGAHGESHVHLRHLNLQGGAVELAYSGAGTAYRGEAFVLWGTVTASGSTAMQIAVSGPSAYGGIGLTENVFDVADLTGSAGVDLAVAARLQNAFSSGSLTKTGAGTLSLDAANTYSGGTVVEAGTLRAGDAEAFGSGAIRVNGGTLDLAGFSVTNQLDLRGGSVTGLAQYAGTQAVRGGVSYSGAVGGNIVVEAGGNLNTTGAEFTGAIELEEGSVLRGTGVVSEVTVNAGALLAPGNSPGTLSVGATTWHGGGAFGFEINDATGIAGTNWDTIDVGGALTLSATAENPFTIHVLSLTLANAAGEALNFDPSQSYRFTFATAASISGFASNAFLFNLSGFANSSTGTWTVVQDGNALAVDYAAAIPEPGACAALAGVLALFVAWRRRR